MNYQGVIHQCHLELFEGYSQPFSDGGSHHNSFVENFSLEQIGSVYLLSVRSGRGFWGFFLRWKRGDRSLGLAGKTNLLSQLVFIAALLF